MVQEAFARAAARPGGFAGIDNPEAWLRTVAVNVVRRRWRRRKLLDLILLRERAVQRHVEAGPSPERTDLTEALDAIPRTVPGGHRAALLRRPQRRGDLRRARRARRHRQVAALPGTRGARPAAARLLPAAFLAAFGGASCLTSWRPCSAASGSTSPSHPCPRSPHGPVSCAAGGAPCRSGAVAAGPARRRRGAGPPGHPSAAGGGVVARTARWRLDGRRHHRQRPARPAQGSPREDRRRGVHRCRPGLPADPRMRRLVYDLGQRLHRRRPHVEHGARTGHLRHAPARRGAVAGGHRLPDHPRRPAPAPASSARAAPTASPGTPPPPRPRRRGQPCPATPAWSCSTGGSPRCCTTARAGRATRRSRRCRSAGCPRSAPATGPGGWPGSRDGHPAVAVSRDGGASWTPDDVPRQRHGEGVVPRPGRLRGTDRPADRPARADRAWPRSTDGGAHFADARPLTGVTVGGDLVPLLDGRLLVVDGDAGTGSPPRTGAPPGNGWRACIRRSGWRRRRPGGSPTACPRSTPRTPSTAPPGRRSTPSRQPVSCG